MCNKNVVSVKLSLDCVLSIEVEQIMIVFRIRGWSIKVVQLRLQTGRRKVEGALGGTQLTDEFLPR